MSLRAVIVSSKAHNIQNQLSVFESAGYLLDTRWIHKRDPLYTYTTTYNILYIVWITPISAEEQKKPHMVAAVCV